MRSSRGKVNVLFVMTDISMGGAERLVHNLALKLDRHIFAPSIAWFNAGAIVKEFRDLEIPLNYIPKTKRLDISTMSDLGKIIHDNNIHIVNAHHFMPMFYSFYGSKLINRRRLIYTQHSEWEINLIRWNWRVAGHFFLNRADSVVGVNDNVTKLLQSKFRLKPSIARTIENGVDLQVFANGGNKEALRKELDLSDDDRVIGCVANIKKVKNHIFLLKAFRELVADSKKLKLLLVGTEFKDGTEDAGSELRKFIVQHRLEDFVRILGYREDIADLLSLMDVFCLPSLKEGLPISLIEAMAAGLAVVGTNVEGIRDVLVHGRNGFIAQLEDVNGLKSALLTVLKDESLRRKFGQESRRLAENKYSLSRCVNEYENLFLSMVNAHEHNRGSEITE